MDDNWLNILSNRLRSEEIPLPEGDWVHFETTLLRPNERKHRVITWSVITAPAVAASIVFAIVSHFTSTEPFNNTPPPTIAEVDNVENTFHTVSVERKQENTRHSSISKMSPLDYIAKEDEQLDNVQDQEESIINQRTENHSTRKKDSDSTIVNNIDNIWLSFKNEDIRKQPSIIVSPFIKGAGNNTTVKGMNNDYSLGDYDNSTIMNYYYQMDAQHYAPLSVGLDISLTLLPKIAVTTGVSVSIYKSKLSGYSQKVYYLGIPLKVELTTWHSNYISTWIGAGAKVDRQIYGKFDAFKLKDDTFNWSITGDVGIQYELLPQIGLFVEPELSYYFKPTSPTVLTYRTENPLMFTLGGGIRFNF